MSRKFLAVAACGALAFVGGCAEEDEATQSDQPPVYSDRVDSSGLVWAIGTMGGLKAIDMADTVVRSVNLGYRIYDYVAVCGRYVWVAGGTGNLPLQRVTLHSDTSDTMEETVSQVSGRLGRPAGLEAAGGRVWAIGRGTKAVFGVDTGTNVMNTQVDFSGVPDSGGCAALVPLGPTMYVLSTNPFVVHAVDMASAALRWQLVLENTADSTGKAYMGAAGDELYVYAVSRRELVTVRISSRSVVRRVTIRDVTRSDEMMSASSAGVFVSERSDATHRLLSVSASTGATLAQYGLSPGVEAVSAVQAFGQRLFMVLIDSSTGQNAVLELRPSDMTLMHRVNRVYVTRVAVQR